MNRIFALLTTAVLTCAFNTLQGQDELSEKVLFTVENDTVTADEYMAVYNKNREVGEQIDPKTPTEYLDLYINFKLKVHQAKELGYDTLPKFRREYRNYYDQLAKPYLSDKDKTQELVREAYERGKYDVHASHILIPLDGNDRDTAEAYQKAINIREQIVEGEMDFAEAAREYSEDKYSAKKGGDIGYFTVFNMVYPFETGAYNTEEGEVSMPVRSQYGYHLIKVHDKREARGKITVAHIMISSKKENVSDEQARQKAQEIYEKLEGGADFGELATQYSDDKASAQQGGVLQPFGINRMFPEFEDAAFGLEEKGDFTKPVKTPVGYHIIKLVKKHERPSFSEMQDELTKKVKRDMRSEQTKQSILKRLKKEYSFKEYPDAITRAVGMVDKSFLNRKFEKPQGGANEELLFEFASKEYHIGDFMDYLVEAQNKLRRPKDLKSEVYEAYDKFVEEEIIAYEKSHLAEKYPEFRHLAREYFEGILLFDITNDKVWRKAVKDTTGLKKYFEANRDNYTWDKRYKVVIATASDKKMAKKAAKMLKRGKSREEIKEKLNKDSQLGISFKSGTYEIGEQQIFERFAMNETGITSIKESGDSYQFIQIKDIMEPARKTLKEARGAVITDHQTKLENEWIDSLKEKYEVKVNQKVLDKVVEKLNGQS